MTNFRAHERKSEAMYIDDVKSVECKIKLLPREPHFKVIVIKYFALYLCLSIVCFKRDRTSKRFEFF